MTEQERKALRSEMEWSRTALEEAEAEHRKLREEQRCVTDATGAALLREVPEAEGEDAAAFVTSMKNRISIRRRLVAELKALRRQEEEIEDRATSLMQRLTAPGGEHRLPGKLEVLVDQNVYYKDPELLAEAGRQLQDFEALVEGLDRPFRQTGSVLDAAFRQRIQALAQADEEDADMIRQLEA